MLIIVIERKIKDVLQVKAIQIIQMIWNFLHKGTFIVL